MQFLKKTLFGLGALFFIFVGGAGTQSHNTLLQGGGFLGLIIGLVVLYIFAKMAWRAMGCLPSIFLILAIVAFIVYAIGGFNGGISNLSNNLKSFIGQGTSSTEGKVGNASQFNLLSDEDFDVTIRENFSSPSKDAQQQPQQQAEPAEEESFLDKLIGKPRTSKQSPSSGGMPDMQNAPTIYSAAEVISGDTLRINGRYFRLFGIDAPERNQTCADATGRSYSCGYQAAEWLSSWIQNNTLECKVIQKDGNGNMIGTCALGAYDIGAAIVNAGWAVAYPKHTDIYMPYQTQAGQNKRGLWQGDFYMPWDWRKIQAQKPKIKIIKPKTPKRRTILNPLG